MKTLNNYLIESSEDGKNGHWEEFSDEDTGEIVQLWVPDINPEEEAKKVELARIESEKYEKALAKQKEIDKVLDPLEDELWSYKEELKDLAREYKELQIDHEEEVGGLYVQGKEAEAEKLAQEYGVKFNELEKRQQTLKNKIKKLEPRIENLHHKRWKLWNY